MVGLSVACRPDLSDRGPRSPCRVITGQPVFGEFAVNEPMGVRVFDMEMGEAEDRSRDRLMMAEMGIGLCRSVAHAPRARGARLHHPDQRDQGAGADDGLHRRTEGIAFMEWVTELEAAARRSIRRPVARSPRGACPDHGERHLTIHSSARSWLKGPAPRARTGGRRDRPDRCVRDRVGGPCRAG